jgi:hypothetical protein
MPARDEKCKEGVDGEQRYACRPIGKIRLREGAM